MQNDFLGSKVSNSGLRPKNQHEQADLIQILKMHYSRKFLSCYN